MSAYGAAASRTDDAFREPGEATRDSGEADIVARFRDQHLDLVRLAALLLGDSAAAEDVVQEVFARLWAGRGRLAAAGVSAPYLYRAVVNACRSVHRRRKATRRFDATFEALLLSEPGMSAEDAALAADQDRRVLQALSALPRRQQEALILRYYQRLSEAEIAEVMEISRGTVKSTTARGLAALGRRLRQEGL
jgi:RNA polymerase sigma-70 factor (sigma-E family)